MTGLEFADSGFDVSVKCPMSPSSYLFYYEGRRPIADELHRDFRKFQHSVD